MNRILVLLGFILLIGCTDSKKQKDGEEEQRPPNIVLIFTDDQGYADVGVYGADDIATPNLDRMAEEGLYLSDFNVTSTVCSPSRYS